MRIIIKFLLFRDRSAILKSFRRYFRWLY